MIGRMTTGMVKHSERKKHQKLGHCCSCGVVLSWNHFSSESARGCEKKACWLVSSWASSMFCYVLPLLCSLLSALLCALYSLCALCSAVLCALCSVLSVVSRVDLKLPLDCTTWKHRRPWRQNKLRTTENSMETILVQGVGEEHVQEFCCTQSGCLSVQRPLKERIWSANTDLQIRIWYECKKWLSWDWQGT